MQNTHSLDRIAVVTGGTSGIGAAIATRLMEEGWVVVTVSRRSLENSLVSQTSPVAGTLSHIGADLGEKKGLYGVCAELRRRFEKLDLLVNCAGSISDEDRLEHVAYEDVERTLRLNSLAPLFLTRCLADLLRSANGSVVHIGSIYGDIPDTDVAAYCLSKALLPQLTRMQARSLAPDVRVNLVLPGHIDTPMTRSAPADYLEAVKATTPMRELGRPEDIASTVVFLASEAARFITGAEFRVDGGYMANVGLAT